MSGAHSSGMSLLKSFCSKLESNQAIINNFNELQKVWSELWDEKEQETRREILINDLCEKVNEPLTDIIFKENETMALYTSKIEELLEFTSELQKTLNVKIEHDDISQLPYHNIAKLLNQRVEKYRIIKQERINELTELKRQENEICENLGLIPIDMLVSSIPTEEQLKQLANHLKTLKEEELNRKQLLNESRAYIVRVCEELEVTPMLQIQKQLLSDDYLNIKLTHNNIKQIEDWKDLLEQEVKDAEEAVKDLKQKLFNIWLYLDIKENEKKEFLENHEGFSVSVRNKIKDELKRLEQIKRENIKEIILRMKELLMQEWDKCLISQEQRNKFRHLHSDIFNEDLCTLFEFEINELKNYYEKNEKLFQLINAHNVLFDKYRAMEENSKNANRYYNRGGQLLQEEKERNRIKKELPKVEEELKTLLLQYKEENGTDFTCFGKPLFEELESKWMKSSEKPTKTTTAKSGSAVKRRILTPSQASTAKQAKFTPTAKPTRSNTVLKSAPSKKMKKPLDDYHQFEESLESKSHLPIRSSSLSDLRRFLPKITVTSDNSKSQVNTPVKQGPSTQLTTPRRTPRNVTPNPMSYSLRRSNTFVTPTSTGKVGVTRAAFSTTKKNKLPFLF